jgi:deoxyadenosine/deoxycytidine kinase
MQRITKRGREGESIPLHYIQKCHDYHEAWINADTTACKKLVIDANPEIGDNRVKKIMEFIDELM